MSKKAVISATVLLLCGCILFVGVMAVLRWDFSKLSTDRFESNSYQIADPFTAVRIVIDTAQVAIMPAEDRITAVDCYEPTKAKHAVSVKDGVLTIEVQETRKWYERLGIHFRTPKVAVYLPSGVYSALTIEGDTVNVEIDADFRFTNMDIEVSTGNVNNYASVVEDMTIRTSTGNIGVQNLSAGSMTLTVSTGKVSVSSVTCTGDVSVDVSTGKSVFTALRCRNLTSTGSTGNLVLSDVIATETLLVERSTGNVSLDGCDAASLSIKTSTGDVTGSLLTGKTFVTHTSTGRVKVPATTTGGKCEITTSTGNITME